MDDTQMMDHCDVDHPRSSKRLCSSTGSNNNSDSVTTAKRHNNGSTTGGNAADTAKARDCYQEMTACADRQLMPPLLRHDWFYEIPTISKYNIDATAAAAAPPAAAAAATDLPSELQSLDRQLQQVKRRFHEASERCAEAVEAYAATNTTPNYEFEQARRACNPLEILGETRPGGLNHGLFINRSAIKLANIDAQLNFTLLTNNHHHYQHQQQQLGHINNNAAAQSNNATYNLHHDENEDTFYFADLCAAPGGFSEYLLRRFCHKKGNHHNVSSNHYTSCRGYGMSLEGDNDQGHGTPWKISPGPLFMGGMKNFKKKNGRGGGGGGVYYHICRGEDGTGDIFQWRNVQALQQDIASQQQNMMKNHPPMNQQDGQQQPRVATGRVALVLADGGVDAQRNIEHPEAETQKLVVCQVAAALALLQPGGRLVLKLLGCQTTPMLQCVLQELYDNFHHLQVLKPISSRPASAERYLVCTGYLGCHGTNGNSNNSVQQQHATNDNVVFDGPRWINRVLLGQFKINPALATYLAQVDCDMMRLNLKACFAILSHLDSKTMRLTTPAAAAVVPMGMRPGNRHRGGGDRGDDDDMKDEGDEDEDEKWIAQGYNNYHNQNHHQQQHHHKGQLVKAYRAAWKLF